MSNYKEKSRRIDVWHEATIAGVTQSFWLGGAFSWTEILKLISAMTNCVWRIYRVRGGDIVVKVVYA